MSKIGIIGKAILEHHPNGFFSLDQIVKLTKFSRKYVTDTLVVLSQEGLIKKIKKQKKEHIPGHSPRFSLTYRVGDKKVLAARIAPRLKKETIQDRMWFIIRKRRSFVLRDLIVFAGAKRGTARWFLKKLRKMGIIRPSRTGGGPGVEWTLINDELRRPYIKTRRKEKGSEMREEAARKMDTEKKDHRIKVMMSKEEVAMVKRQASKFNLSVSAYLRMLILKARGVDKETPQNSL